MTTPASDSTTLLVIFHSIGDHDDAHSAVQAMADVICHGDFGERCATSVAIDTDPRFANPPILGLIEATVRSAALTDLVGGLEPMFDSACHSVLEVDERRIATYERAWPLASPSPGERIVSLVARKPSMSRHDFDAYWKNIHAPVALSFTVPPWGYTQYVTRRSLLDDSGEPDGVFVMHFRSPEDRRARWEEHPDEAARGAADAANFMNIASTKTALMQETIWC